MNEKPKYIERDGEKRRLQNCARCGEEHYGPVFECMGREFLLDFLCPKCDDEVEREELAREAQARASKGRQSITDAEAGQSQWRNQVCPFQRFHHIERSKLPAAALPHWDGVMAWCPEDYDTGLVLVGPSETGKSMLIHALAEKLFLSGAGVFVTYMAAFARTVGSHRTTEREELLDRCVSSPVLVLDDIDKAKLTDRVETDLFYVIDTRERYERPMLGTLNADPAQLGAMMGENRGMPLLNRLKRNCQFVKIGG